MQMTWGLSLKYFLLSRFILFKLLIKDILKIETHHNSNNSFHHGYKT